MQLLDYQGVEYQQSHYIGDLGFGMLDVGSAGYDT